MRFLVFVKKNKVFKEIKKLNFKFSLKNKKIYSDSIYSYGFAEVGGK